MQDWDVGVQDTGFGIWGAACGMQDTGNHAGWEYGMQGTLCGMGHLGCGM